MKKTAIILASLFLFICLSSNSSIEWDEWEFKTIIEQKGQSGYLSTSLYKKAINFIWINTNENSEPSIYYKRSNKEGKSWRKNKNLGGYFTYSNPWPPEVAAGKKNVYYVYTRDNNLVFNRSSNKGRKWEDERILAENAAGYVDIAVDKNNVHVVYERHNESRTICDVCYMMSENEGRTFCEAQNISKPKKFKEFSWFPQVEVSNNTVHVGYGDFYYEGDKLLGSFVCYARSINNGRTWRKPKDIIGNERGVPTEQDEIYNKNGFSVIENQVFFGLVSKNPSGSKTGCSYSNDGGKTFENYWIPGFAEYLYDKPTFGQTPNFLFAFNTDSNSSGKPGISSVRAMKEIGSMTSIAWGMTSMVLPIPTNPDHFYLTISAFADTTGRNSPYSDRVYIAATERYWDDFLNSYNSKVRFTSKDYYMLGTGGMSFALKNLEDKKRSLQKRE